MDAADRTEFSRTVRRLLERHGAATASAPAGAGDYDRTLWHLLAGQVGVAGLAVPERFGGSAMGYAACHLVLAELGRAVLPSPFLASSVLATQALVLAADEVAAGDLLPGLAAGSTTAALIGLGPDDTLSVTGSDGGWLVTGSAGQVLDGARADLLLVLADPETSEAEGLFLLDAGHPGLQRRLLPTMDESLHLAQVQCQAVPARRLSRPDATGADRTVRRRLSDLAATAITADQIGGARRCLELTVEYTRQRVQFGRPIGSFQAIKHRLADLLVLVESAHSASEAAAEAWSDDTPDASVLAALAKSYCSEAYRAVTAETIQLHGGIGFTWEHPAHRYFKRAHSTSTLFGRPEQHRQRIAEHLGLTGRAVAGR
jgi:alkylation response protein AidB-like acyl-CoA dehydrogenase